MAVRRSIRVVVTHLSRLLYQYDVTPYSYLYKKIKICFLTLTVVLVFGTGNLLYK